MNADELRYLLRRPIAFHRALADVAGGATGGLFLSQLLYWSDRGEDEDGWIYKTIEEWQEETALTRSEQERARKILVERGVLAVERRGLPARLFFRLDVDAIASLLDSAILIARSPQTRMPDPADKNAGSGDHIYTETTSETTQKENLRSIDEMRRAIRPSGLGRR